MDHFAGVGPLLDAAATKTAGAPHNFGQAEIPDVPEADTLDRLIGRVRETRLPAAPFYSDDDVRQCLAPGYELFLSIADDLRAIDVIRDLDELKGDRKYRFPKNKPAYLVTSFVCRPKNKAERQQCSAWSCFYRHAQTQVFTR